MNEHFNPFLPDNFVEPAGAPKKPAPKGSIFTNPLVIIGLVVLILTTAGALYLTLRPNTSAKNELSNYNPVVQRLKADSVQFCNYFYNLSYTSYKEARRKSEFYMSSNLLTQYKEIFYETQFTDDVINSKLSTDYIYNQVLEGVIDGQAAIKVIGYIKYTSTTKNVSVEMPVTSVLIWVKDKNEQWKIDNFRIEM